MPGFAQHSLRATLVAGLLLTASISAFSAEERIGVSMAVNPDATGTPPGAATRRMVIGQDVIFNEHITTTASGQTQLLFLDESSMTIGPNSDLTIDQFVYDPKTGTGKLAMSATRGLMRYVGGKLSKNEDAVTLRTATATLAVRGGSFLTSFDSEKTDAAFLYGEHLKLTGNVGEPQIIRRPGYESTALKGGPASNPFPVPPGRLAQQTLLLDGHSGSTGGATVIPTDTTVADSGIARTISGNLTDSLQQAQNQPGNPDLAPPNPNPPSSVNTVQSSANQGSANASPVNILDPTGATRVFAFNLAANPSPSNIPFSINDDAALAAAPTPLYLVAPASTAIGSTSTPSQARELSATVAFSGQGIGQSSTAIVQGGVVSTLQSNGTPFIVGAVRGVETAGNDSETITSPISGAVNTTGNTLGFTLGQTKYDTVSDTNPVVTGPSAVQPQAVETEFVSTTSSLSAESYSFAQPAVAQTVPAGVGTSRTTRTLTGFFGGLMATNATPSPYALTGTATIATDSVANTVTANFASDRSLGSAATGPTGGISSIAMNFGGTQSVFIDDNIFGAFENAAVAQQIDGRALVVDGSTHHAGQLYLVSSATAALPTGLLPSGASFCQCQYLQWGYWGGDLLTGNSSNSNISRIDHGHINFWVAGTPTVTMPTSGIGTYNGAAIGSVDNAGFHYVAAGGFSGVLNFATHAGTWSITNFDGPHSFSVSGIAPLTGSNYSFGGSAPGVAGIVNGSFYGPMAAETGGNFSFHSTVPGTTYLASGIFAGKR